MIHSTLESIYPRGTFLAPRLDHRNARWVTSDVHAIEFMTASLIACAGGYPMLVHKAAMSPHGLEIMVRCGLNVGDAIEVYETPEAYEAAFRRRLQDGENAALVFPIANEHAGHVLVEPGCLEFLNNKGNIAQLAGVDNVPRRENIGNASLAERWSVKLPVTLKVATNEPNGGGLGVAVCRKRRQLNRALWRFAESETLVSEQFIEATHNWCVQFAVLPDGSVTEIGASEQLCTRNGIHGGNLLADDTPSTEVFDLARTIAEEGGRRGFRGLCGFDILTDFRGKPYAIDLNFRPVSSAAFVLEMRRSITRTATGRFARLAFCRANVSLSQMIRLCEDGFEEGWLVPLATFDPEYGGLDPGPARLRIIILGESRKVLCERESVLASRGIDFFRMPTRWDRFRERFGP